jgi:hypothetical protein
MFDWLSPKPKRKRPTTDRRAGGTIPHVGKQPRARTKTAAWRRKRSDAGTKRGPKAKKSPFGF